MKGYVINLDRETERWSGFKERWKDCKTIEFERYSGITNEVPHNGLSMTHQKIIKENYDQEMILILEDDATCEPDFDRRFTECLNWLKNKEWNFFYGGYTFPVDLRKSDNTNLIYGRFITAHFIIINKRMYDMILAFDLSMPIDVLYSKFEGVGIIKSLSKQISSYSSIRKEVVDYNKYFIDAENRIINFMKKKKYEWYNLFLPTDKIMFSSFDIINYKLPHAVKFIDIAESIPYDVIISQYLDSSADWVFSDAHMLSHASLMVERVDSKLAAIVTFGNIPDAANIAILPDNSLVLRKDILTVITSYYKPKDKEREDEINEAIMLNLNNRLVKEVILLAETTPPFVHQKLRIIPVVRKPLYHDYFQLANTVYGLVMITNSDISLMFNEMKIIPKMNEIFALSRHELDGTLIDAMQCSHDCLIFWAPLKLNGAYFYYPQDVWGSENLTMYYLNKMGYKLLNPCKQLKILHHHKNDDRPIDRYRVNIINGKSVCAVALPY